MRRCLTLSITRASNIMEYYSLHHTFLTSSRSSHTRLENKLNLLIAEVRAGRREGSVISTQTFDTTARDDQETWEALRRELEDIGISSGVITEKRQFIIAWFQEAVAAGRLEEDVASDDSNSAISLHEPEDPAGSSDDSRMSNTSISSMRFEPSATQRRAALRSESRASSPLRQPADRSSPLPQKKGNSRIRVTYLLQKLLGREGQFLQAAKDGDVSTIRMLLDKGVDIQARGTYYRSEVTALHLASFEGKERTVQFLLSKGADVHAKDESGETALHRAAISGNKQIVNLLLEHGADTEWKDSSGETALMQAAAHGHQDTVQLLLDQGANIESEDKNGWTAFVYAASKGHQNILQLLSEKGANMESMNTSGSTAPSKALLCAAGGGHQSIVQLLLEQGADKDSQDSKGNTALITAALLDDDQDMVRLLLERGVNLELKNSIDCTALMYAAYKGNRDTVQRLLDKGAQINNRDIEGWTAHKHAEKFHHKKIAQMLRNAGARR